MQESPREHAKAVLWLEPGGLLHGCSLKDVRQVAVLCTSIPTVQELIFAKCFDAKVIFAVSRALGCSSNLVWCGTHDGSSGCSWLEARTRRTYFITASNDILAEGGSLIAIHAKAQIPKDISLLLVYCSCQSSPHSLLAF